MEEELKDIAAIKAYTKSVEHWVAGKLPMQDRDNYRWGYIEGYLEAALNMGYGMSVIPTNFFDSPDSPKMTDEEAEIMNKAREATFARLRKTEPSKPYRK